MLLGSLDLLFNDPLAFLQLFPVIVFTMGTALLLGITVHEFSHAMAATRLGDVTARSMGRLSLNPLRHLDPVGTLLLILVGFGWGKPVLVNPLHLRNGRLGMAIVSAAGPLSNFLTAGLFALPIHFGLIEWHSPFSFTATLSGGIVEIIADLIGFIIFYNIVLGVFNLIPLFPLDGSKVVWGLLPRTIAWTFGRLEPYGPAILIGIIGIDFVTDIGILRRILIPVVNYLGHIIVGHGLF